MCVKANKLVSASPFGGGGIVTLDWEYNSQSLRRLERWWLSGYSVEDSV